MKCLICESFSFSHICKKCRVEYFAPNLFKRKLSSGLKVFSFYRYEDISEFVKTKNSYLGFYIFNILAKLSLKEFLKNMDFQEKISLIPIDDRVTSSGYSHTAILTNSIQKKNIIPRYGSLISKSKVKYIGQDLEFRLKNGRDFQVSKKLDKNIPVILVDDVITTGTTLKEADIKLKEFGVKTLFALTLATTKIR